MNSSTSHPSGNVTRRQFLASSASSAAYLAVASSALVAPAKVWGANETLGVGFIGVGGRGRNHLNIVQGMSKTGEGVRIVALNDA